MPRLTLALVVLVGVLAGALGYSAWSRPVPQTDVAAVRAIVDSALAEREAATPPVAPALAAPAVAQLDPAQLNPLIENFLMSDPTILQRLSTALDTQLRTAEREQATTAIASMRDAIFNDPTQVVVGNPQGDVTLVELFDYNCS